VLKFLQVITKSLTHAVISQSINELNNVKYRFTKYNSHTEVNTVSLYCF